MSAEVRKGNLSYKNFALFRDSRFVFINLSLSINNLRGTRCIQDTVVLQ